MHLNAARHPVLDRTGNLVGYELLLRSGILQGVPTAPDCDSDRRMLDAALHGFGLDTLVGCQPALLRVGAEFLTRGHWAALPSQRIILKLRLAGAVTPELVAACEEAKAAGQPLLLADADQVPELDRLIPHVDALSVDFASATVADRTAFAERHGDSGRRLIAEKVATHDQFREATAAGYDWFQGYFFCEPEGFTTRALAPGSMSSALLVAEVNRPDLDLDALEELIKHDVTLSVKLLRYLQSAAMGWRHEVATIGQGLRILGDQGARKWASLTAYSLVSNGKPQELVTTSLVRAQLCEEFGRTAGLPQSRCSALFLVGLLSTLDALLDRPMAVAIAEMPLNREVAATLRGETTPMSGYLSLAVAYDQGEWDAVDALSARLGIPAEALPEAYHRTVSWIGRLAAA